MIKNKIVHIMILEKFIPPFIDLVNNNFDSSEHQFVILGKKRLSFGLNEKHSILWIDSVFKLINLFFSINNSRKIIIHGLWSEIFNFILFLQPWLLKKSYWVMWGGDFYFPQKQTWIKKQIIKKIANLVTYVKGDYELVRNIYNAKGTLCECFMYPSNIYKSYNLKKIEKTSINIQLGNSADYTNNHKIILNNLTKYKNENIKIFLPLSYGDKKYAQEVIEYGKELFGEKFIPLVEFMSFEKYLDFLSDIDIAIFAHERQQAMGNIITLLGLGKKVYIRSDISTWELFKDIHVKIYDVNMIEIDMIDKNIEVSNKMRIKEYFSEKNYLKQLANLFES